MGETVELKRVTKIYKMGDERVTALSDITVTFQKGNIYCLTGKSGSGKSTLLNVTAGLEKPTSGEIIISGGHVERMSEKQLALFRQKYIGFIFQSYNLLPALSAIENVMMPLIFRGVKPKARAAAALKMLDAVGLKSRAKHKPSQMSGGQQQRVSIARAFVNNPAIVFADEPTGNLDTKTTTEMMDLMCGMARDMGHTLVIVTHNPDLSCYANQTIRISDGRIESIA